MKKKTLNTSTFICNVFLSSSLFLSRNVIVEWFLLALDASVLTYLSYSFILTFKNLTYCLLHTFPLEFEINEKLVNLLNLYLSRADFFLCFSEKLTACFILSLKCLPWDFAYQSLVVIEVCLIAFHFFNSLCEDHKLSHFVFTLAQIAFYLYILNPSFPID